MRFAAGWRWTEGAEPASGGAPPRSAPGQATLAFAGDILFAERAAAVARAAAPECVWGDVLPTLAASDGVFVNLEGPITHSRRRWRRGWKAVHLRADPATLALLTAANIRFASLANNHILDYEAEGLADTIAALDTAGIAHAGAGADRDAAATAKLFPVGGVRVGVISFTDRMPEFAAGPRRPGTNYLSLADDAATGALCARAQALRAAGADVVVVSAHWGPNLRLWPSTRFRRFARALVDGGVDVFHGHSAHFVQGVEVRPRGIILYDTGDFLDDVWWFPFVPSYWSCLFLVDFAKGRVANLRVVPVTLRPGRIELARGAAAIRTVARLCRRSEWVLRDAAPPEPCIVVPDSLTEQPARVLAEGPR